MSLSYACCDTSWGCSLNVPRLTGFLNRGILPCIHHRWTTTQSHVFVAIVFHFRFSIKCVFGSGVELLDSLGRSPQNTRYPNHSMPRLDIGGDHRENDKPSVAQFRESTMKTKLGIINTCPTDPTTTKRNPQMNKKTHVNRRNSTILTNWRQQRRRLGPSLHYRRLLTLHFSTLFLGMLTFIVIITNN